MSSKSITTQLKEAQKKIEELEKKLIYAEQQKESNWKQYQEAQREINSIHAALDTLPGITGKRARISEYQEVDLTINARLFSWISSVAFGERKIIKSEEK